MELRQVKGFDAVRGLRGLRGLKSYLLTGGVCLGVGIVVGALVIGLIVGALLGANLATLKHQEATVPKSLYDQCVANGEKAALLWQKSLNPRVKDAPASSPEP
jgi:hypothetical protein